jgi:hypothetical protein
MEHSRHGHATSSGSAQAEAGNTGVQIAVEGSCSDDLMISLILIVIGS